MAMTSGGQIKGLHICPRCTSQAIMPTPPSNLRSGTGLRKHHWGFGPMPPIRGLTEDEVAAIIVFVRETQRTEGFEPYPP